MLVTTLTLVSGEPPAVESPGTEEPASGFAFSRIVYNKKSVKISDFYVIQPALFSYNRDLRLVTDDDSYVDGEIVFGDTNREISTRALEAMYDSFGGSCTGYIVYREGNNVAVCWTDDMKETALDAFISECIDKRKMELDEGIICMETQDTREYIMNGYWQKLVDQGCPAETIEALKTLNSFYNGPAICEWMANLWDPEVGGFYYSNSARDYEGFLPDLESTNQLTNWLVGNSATNGLGRSEFYPEWMKEKIVKFVKDMQSPVDGYFYHPQWPQGKENLSTDRYGRDLSWGVNLLKSFYLDTDGDGKTEKQYPNYCAPSGYKCKYHTENGGQCDYSSATLTGSGSEIAAAVSASPAVTVGLREGAAGAVAKVANNAKDAIAAATVSSRPDYSSPEAFTAWLWAYNGSLEEMMTGKNSSGRAHNLNALQDEIIGKGFGDELIAWLDDVQQQIWDYQIANGEEPTGVWQTSIDKRLVWGVLKYIAFYNNSVCGKKIELEKALAMVRACTKVIELAPDSSWALNDMMNQWQSINNIKSNVKKYYGQEGVDKIYEITRENIVFRIENCIEKIKPYKLPDGTFCYTSSGKSMTKIYGVPISMGVPEGDVNGNSLVCTMYRGIFDAIGYTVVPLCTRLDGENFLKIVESLQPIEKKPVE